MVRRLALAALALAATLPAPASAMPGLYVNDGKAPISSPATHVVVMREGKRTVISIQPTYQGPPADFALVIPVPATVDAASVKTLPSELFARVDRLTAPRLVEYWEQDPCDPQAQSVSETSRAAPTPPAATGSPSVLVEAELSVGEYDTAILDAKESGALDDWLRGASYALPDGAKEALAPYVEQGMKLLVAKVDASKVKITDGRATLSPIRIHYDADRLALPLRLGLLSAPSSGSPKQDLVVHVLSRKHRYQASGFDNVTIPTNLDLTDGAKARFGELYAALFDATLAKNPKAVVTEYAWDARTCEHCPAPPLSPRDLATLGADVAFAADAGRGATEGEPDAGARLVGEVTVGKLDAPRLIVQKVADMLPGFRRCLANAREDTPAINGSITLVMTMLPDGTPDIVSSTGGEGLPSRLVSCLKTRATLAKLPPTPGRSVKLEIPLELASVPAPPPVAVEGSFVLSRLHARYDETSLTTDLVLEEAGPITGGREIATENAELDRGSKPADANNFQARYVVRHPWAGPIACSDPVRGKWGGPPPGVTAPKGITPALGLAFAKRGDIDLPSQLVTDVPALSITATGKPPEAAPVEGGVAAAGNGEKGGCGSCAVGGEPSRAPALALALLGLGLTFRRSGRRARS